MQDTTTKGIISAVMESALDDIGTPIPDDLTLEGDTACESEIVLAALEEFSTPEEYNALIENHATAMELYGIIDNADVVLEAQRNIVKLNKFAKFDSIERRTCIRLAAKADDPLYKKYSMYREKWREFREKIYTKYKAKARRDTKIIIQNARRKASGMNTDAGKSITDKMDREIKRIKEDKA